MPDGSNFNGQQMERVWIRPADRSLINYEDPDHRGGPGLTSPAYQRAKEQTLEALKIVRRLPQHPKGVNAMRAHLGRMNLLPAQLYSLLDLTHTLAQPRTKFLSDEPIPDETPMPEHDCTVGEHRAAAYMVTRAAYSLLLETYRPACRDDLFALLGTVCSMASHAHLCGGDRREQWRARKRLVRNVENAIGGIPLDYGFQTKEAKARRAVAN